MDPVRPAHDPGALLGGKNSLAVLYGVCLTLAMVAIGLAVTTRAGWSASASSTLLQEEDEEDEDPEYSTNPVVRAIAGVYWPVMAAIYLAWSFLTGDWHISWVLWPVAGVLYAGLSGLSVALRSEDDSRAHAAVGPEPPACSRPDAEGRPPCGTPLRRRGGPSGASHELRACS